MASIAFFAPLKSPGHPVPSGDRQMARNLLAMMRGAGHTVTVVSDVRLYDGRGDADTQTKLAQEAAQEAARLITMMQDVPPTIWITYHNYYKAPDLLGPTVTDALDILYVQIESTRARKRLTGPWAAFAAKAEEASDQAAAILYQTSHDLQALEAYRKRDQHLVHFHPSKDHAHTRFLL